MPAKAEARIEITNSKIIVEPNRPFVVTFKNIGPAGADLDLLQSNYDGSDVHLVKQLFSDIEGDEQTVEMSQNFQKGLYAFRATDIATGETAHSPIFELGDGFAEPSTSSAQSGAPPTHTEQPPGESSGGDQRNDADESRSSDTLATATSTPDALTTSAIAGISVGATVGGLLLLSSISWYLLRHRRTRQPVEPVQITKPDQMSFVGQLDGKEIKAELEAGYVVELPDDRGWVFHNAAELAGRRKEALSDC